MNGAESVLRTLADSGVTVCFANPGTSEMHLVAALDRVPGVRGVMLTFDDFIVGMEQFGTRILPLMQCRQGIRQAA